MNIGFKKSGSTRPRREGRYLSGLENEHSDPFIVREGKFSYGQLKDASYYSDWTEHVFLSDDGQKEVVGRTFNFSKIFYIKAFLGLLFITLISRAAWLQLIKGNYYYSLAEGNRLRVELIEPKRGIIYDRNLVPLVRNTANFVLYLRPIDLPKDDLERDNLIRHVADILDEGTVSLSKSAVAPVGENLGGLSLVADTPSYFKIKTLLDKIVIGSLESYQPLFVVDNIDYDRAMVLSLELNKLPGVFLSNKIRREYIFPVLDDKTGAKVSSLSHLLGYTGKISEAELSRMGSDYSLIDYVGKSGLEYFWETDLKGLSGRKNIEVDALGRQKKVVNEVPAKDGANLRLAIDSELQKKTEEVVGAYLKKLNLKRASVIIMNPQNGEVLALLSLPAYDNNYFAKGISQDDYQKYLTDPDRPLFNRAISGEFPSGSTFKLVVSSAALQEKVITETTSFISTGGLRLGQWFFPDWKAGGHGVTNVKKALADSVNTFFYYIGGGYQDFIGLGVDRLAKYAKLFGMGVKSGIDLPNEATGFVPTADWKKTTKGESWYIGDTYHFAIGQGDVLVTPLQVANFTAAVANGGKLMEPHLVDAILDSNNNVVREIAPQVIRENFIDAANINIVREGLRQTVTSGSARSLQIVPVPVAGKTGTAQWSTKKAPHAWFTGFAPYDNPQVVITVMVEEGKEGSTVAVPIAREILQWYFGGRSQATTTVPIINAPTSTEVYLD
ncbi:MAG: penicillin-binding protein 2 [Candidatus Falkowbacteria bacterium]